MCFVNTLPYHLKYPMKYTKIILSPLYKLLITSLKISFLKRIDSLQYSSSLNFLVSKCYHHCLLQGFHHSSTFIIATQNQTIWITICVAFLHLFMKLQTTFFLLMPTSSQWHEYLLKERCFIHLFWAWQLQTKKSIYKKFDSGIDEVKRPCLLNGV